MLGLILGFIGMILLIGSIVYAIVEEDLKFGGIFAIIGLFLLVSGMLFVIVPAGSVGVQDTFGNVDDNVLQPGLHFKFPITDVHIMSVKSQEVTDNYKTLTNEGLDVTIDLTVLYRLDSSKAAEMYKTVGVDYFAIVGTPQIRSVVRDVVAEYDAKAIYSEDRTTIAAKVQTVMTPELKKRGIIVEDVLIRSATLPAKIKNAIEQKLEAEQMISKKEFEVQTEQMEADRKRVEAQGIADAQKIIDESLTNEYLKWYWIETIGNRNGDTYYIPVGADGLPQMATV